jgi:hypothetical protein
MNCATSSAAVKDHQFDTRCWICDASGARHWKERSMQRRIEPEDLRITDRRYGTTLSLVRCGECGFIFSNDKEVDGLVSLYEKMSDPGYEESQEGRHLQMRWLLSKARKANPSGCSLLDVGAGSSLLVAEAKASGLTPSALNLAARSCSWGVVFIKLTCFKYIFPPYVIESSLRRNFLGGYH